MESRVPESHGVPGRQKQLSGVPLWFAYVKYICNFEHTVDKLTQQYSVRFLLCFFSQKEAQLKLHFEAHRQRLQPWSSD